MQKHWPSFVWDALKKLLCPVLCSLDEGYHSHPHSTQSQRASMSLRQLGDVAAPPPCVVGSAEGDFWLVEKAIDALARQL